MKYLRHKAKGFLIPYTISMVSDEWEEYEEGEAAQEEPAARKKPGPKPKAEQADEASE